MPRSATSTAATHALIQSVHYLVPSKQFEPHEVTVGFPENLGLRPDTEVPLIFGATGRGFDRTASRTARGPSATSQHTSAVVAGTDLVSGWTSALALGETEDVIRSVDTFGLRYLYGSSPTRLTGPVRVPPVSAREA